MLKTNYHSHSDFCDGLGKLEDYVKSAIERNFDVFGFSGHAPLPFVNDWTIPEAKLLGYIKEANRLKNRYINKIDIKIGLEIDYIENVTSPRNSVFTNLNLDFIIGSVHFLKNKFTNEYLEIDYTKSKIEQLIDQTFAGDSQLLVHEYYKTIRKMSEHGGMDIIGHLDVIKKTNLNSIYFNESENWYKKEVSKTLECISANKQIIEVNTGTVLKNPSAIYPSPWIIKMANDHDIPIMLNSDAHRPDRIDNYYDTAKEIIIKAGYTELMFFRGDNWERDDIT